MPWQPDYVPEADLIDFVQVNSDNPYVATYGTAASRAIDEVCNRQFGRLDTSAAFEYDHTDAAQLADGRWLVITDDIPATDILQVTVDGGALDVGADGYQLWPRNAIAKGRPYEGVTLCARPYESISVSNRFGWLATPAAVTAAVWLQVNRWNVRRESPYGIAGSPTEGSEVRLSSLLDPDVRALLRSVARARMPR